MVVTAGKTVAPPQSGGGVKLRWLALPGSASLRFALAGLALCSRRSAAAEMRKSSQARRAARGARGGAILARRQQNKTKRQA